MYVKTNAGPTKIPRKLEEVNIEPVFKNYPTDHSPWHHTGENAPVEDELKLQKQKKIIFKM